MQNKSMQERVYELLQTMCVGEVIPIKKITLEIWGRHDQFIRRSYDTYYCKSKQKINVELSEKGESLKEFKVEKGNLKRIK